MRCRAQRRLRRPFCRCSPDRQRPVRRFARSLAAPARRVPRHMHLAAFFAFVAVVTCSAPTFWTALQGTPVEHGGAGLFLPLVEHAHDHTQVVAHRLKRSGFDPAFALLLRHVPGRKVTGQKSPRTRRLGHPARRIEHVAQRVHTLRRILLHQGQVRNDELPLFIADIGRIFFAAFHRSLYRFQS